MKEITMLITVFFFSLSVFSQNQTETEIEPETKDTLLGKYRWTTPLIMTECSMDGVIQENSKELSLSNQKFYLIKTDDQKEVVIQIIKYSIREKRFNKIIKYNLNAESLGNNTFTDNSEQKKHYMDLFDNSENNKYFTVKLSDVNSYAKKYSKYSLSLAFGVLNFPFKFRPDYHGNYDFASSFNLGAAIGITLPHYSYTKFKWSFLSGYGISNIKLSPATTLNENTAKLDSINSFSALSLSLGAMVEYNKIQVGLFIGCDYLSKDVQDYYKWIYNAKPWFSIGFGYAIFSKSDKIAKQKEEKNK